MPNTAGHARRSMCNLTQSNQWSLVVVLMLVAARKTSSLLFVAYQYELPPWLYVSKYGTLYYTGIHCLREVMRAHPGPRSLYHVQQKKK